PVRDLRRVHSVVEMQRAGSISRKQQLSGEQIHLDLTPLIPAVVFHPVDPNRSRIGHALFVNFGDDIGHLVVAEDDMANFVRNEERVGESGSGILVQYAPEFRIVVCPTASKAHVALGDLLDADITAAGCEARDLIWLPRIHATSLSRSE